MNRLFVLEDNKVSLGKAGWTVGRSVFGRPAGILYAYGFQSRLRPSHRLGPIWLKISNSVRNAKVFQVSLSPSWPARPSS